MNNNSNIPLGDYANIERLPKEDVARFLFNARFAQCLVQRRKEMGLTQEALAEKSGVNRVTIAKLESFQRLASTEVILKLLDALDMEIQFVKRAQS